MNKVIVTDINLEEQAGIILSLTEKIEDVEPVVDSDKLNNDQKGLIKLKKKRSQDDTNLKNYIFIQLITAVIQ